MSDNKKEMNEVLTALSATISKCDAKAGALLSAVGIVFGFSMFSVNGIDSKDDAVKVWIYIIGSLYLLAFMMTIAFLTMTIFPRRRTSREKAKAIDHNRYHEDLYLHLKSGDLGEFAKKEPSEEAIVGQIENCTRIAHTKENFLRASSILIAVFSILLIGVIVLLLI